jgi:drug/metabolite transporter (DMT)-like permease
MHQSSGRWQLGLILSLVTSLLWGMLPIALKGILQDMDAATITWYRFLIAALIMWFFLGKKNAIPDLKWLKNKKELTLFIIVTIGLTGNYLLYLVGLDYVTPSAAQIVIQIAPLLLLIGGLIIFKEKFSLLQWLGLFTFLAGLVLFFNHRIETIFSEGSDYSLGLLLIVFAAVLWAAYALAQKQLLNHYSSQQIMFIIYIVGSLVYLPLVDFPAITKLSNLQLGLLLFCCLNTLVAYGSFAEALQHWEASRVSAVLAITPLLTMAFAALTNYLYPGYLVLEELNWISIVGGTVLVIGATVTALAKKKQKLAL